VYCFQLARIILLALTKVKDKNMNKIFLAAAFSFALTGVASAHAHHHHPHSHGVRAVADEPYTFPPQVVVTPHGTMVTAPPGMDVDADVIDGKDASVDIFPTGRGVLGLGFWGL